MIQFHALEIPQLERFLERQKAGLSLKSDIDLDLVLRQILQKANEFVPSESGSILLDDPFRKVAVRARERAGLHRHLRPGQPPPHRPASLREVRHRRAGLPDRHAVRLRRRRRRTTSSTPSSIEQLGHKTHSVVCVPIYIGKTVCGVLELINRLDGNIFTERDKTLLEIFAGYTSFTLQNALDAKRAHELAKKDDLTGLFNDRWFNVRLTETLADARRSGSEAVLIFMDLDRFKAINDGHGHLAGSQVLREVGFLLKRIVQQGDATVARYGGDEFVIILPDTKLDGRHRRLRGDPPDDRGDDVPRARVGFQHAAAPPAGILSASLGIAQHSRRRSRSSRWSRRKATSSAAPMRPCTAPNRSARIWSCVSRLGEDCIRQRSVAERRQRGRTSRIVEVGQLGEV